MLIRHGERIDKFDPFSDTWVPHDPIITPQGCMNAREKGRRIKDQYMTEWQKLVGGQFERIIVESSPYTRTMMTCANICLGMGIH